MTRYATPPGGLPPQSQLLTGRAIFTTAYAVIPKGVMTDIVTSYLPHWEGTRAWVIARPLSGFAETFSQYVMEVALPLKTARYDYTKERKRQLSIEEIIKLQAIADLKARELQNWLGERMGDTSLIEANPIFRAELVAFLGDRSSGPRRTAGS